MSESREQRTLRVEMAGQVLRAEREQAGLTLPQLAEQLGWNRSRLSRYENNETAMSLEVLSAIARKLHIEPEYLLLQCLRATFPKLADADTEVGALVSQIIDFMRTVRPQDR